MLKRIFIAGICSFQIFSSDAKAAAIVRATRPESMKTLTPETIFKRYRNAIVRLEVTLNGASLGVGAGFFISKNGEIATSLHVIRPFLNHPGTEISVKLANGKVVRTVRIGACGDVRGIDLCILKINESTATVLSLNNSNIAPGEAIATIGHPRGLEFSISTGIVSALRLHPSGWREIQVDAAISPGNSGGPIIDRFGRAIGVVYQFERDGQNLNFGILISELERMRTSAQPFLGIVEARRVFFERSRQLARRASDKLLKPALQSIAEKKRRPGGLKWMRVQLEKSNFFILLPDIFQSCERTDESDLTATACSSTGADLVVTVQKRPRTLDGPMLAYNGHSLVDARSLSIVDRLQSEGAWDEQKTKSNTFLSKPSPSRCLPLQNKMAPSKKSYFSNATSVCRFETENDLEPGAISSSQWIEVGNDYYGINVWSVDSGRLVFLQGINDLILASATDSVDETKPTDRAQFRTWTKDSPSRRKR